MNVFWAGQRLRHGRTDTDVVDGAAPLYAACSRRSRTNIASNTCLVSVMTDTNRHN